MFRVHTAGVVGGSTAIVAAKLVQAGIHKRVLTVAFEKQSESDAMWALSMPMPFQPPLVAGAGGYFAPHIRAYIRRSGAPEPHRHPRRGEGPSRTRCGTRTRTCTCPTSPRDGRGVADAVGADPLPRDVPVVRRRLAMVLGERGGRRRGARAASAWVHGTAMRSEPTMFAGRDQVNPQAGQDCAADVYAQAGITDPRARVDAAEVYVPFSWFEPMWLENLGFCAEGEGWKLTEDGATAIDGDIPWNPSGGVLSSNPIGASGMIRFAEAAQQVRGAGRRAPGRRRTGARSATPTAAARSSSRCGWSANKKP